MESPPSNALLGEPPDLDPAGRTIVLARGVRARRAIVLLHGLTATPTQFAALGRRLHLRGANVLIPRLPRHGHADRLTPALEHLTADELAAFGYEMLGRARELGEHVTFAGFSVGGLVCAWIAQRERLDRVVAIAPFLGLSWVPGFLGPGAARLALRLPNRFFWWHPLERERFGGPHGYPRYATHAVAESYRLSHRLLDDAARFPPATRELVLVSNASEMTVNNRAIARLAARWRAHGAEVAQHRLKGLPPSHDIIALERNPALALRVYPQLLALVDA